MATSTMTIIGVLILALIDSVNPSAIVVALYLLAGADSRVAVRIGVYVAAIYLTYLSLGALMLAGLGVLSPGLGEFMRSRAGLLIQGLVGLGLLIYAWTAPSGRSATQAPSPPPSAGGYIALALLGVTVTAMELPTAIPYFAAIALITEAQLSAYAQALILLGYNLIFVLPPILLLLGHLLLRNWLADSYATLRQKLESGARETLLWVAGLVGGWLLVTSAIEFLARSR
ncbi:MAG: GAP family protein [Lysobacterales bacterium]